MDFNFSSNVIDWRMGLAEIDANDSASFRVNFKLDLTHPSGKFAFCADDIWLGAEDWDQFETDLKNWPNSDKEVITFLDMSQYIQLSLKKSVNGMVANISVYEPLADGFDARLGFASRIELDSSFMTKLIDCFSEWPKHW